MKPHKPPKSRSPVASEQHQPPQRGSAESWEASAPSSAATAPRELSTSCRTSTSSGTSMSSRTSTSSRASTGSAPRCTILVAEVYPPRQAVCRTDVSKLDKAIQTPPSLHALLKQWHPRHEEKGETKDVSNGQDQPQRWASATSSAPGGSPQAAGRRAPSPPEGAAAAQGRRSSLSPDLCPSPSDVERADQGQAVLGTEGDKADVPDTVVVGSLGTCPAGEGRQEGLKQAQAHGPAFYHVPPGAGAGESREANVSQFLEADGNCHEEGKQVYVEELKSHLTPAETHSDQHHQEAMEDVAVDGDTVDGQDTGSSTGTVEISLASEELQEVSGHTTEDADTADNFGSDLATVEIPLGEIPPNPEELQEVLGPAAVDGDEGGTQDLVSTPDTTAREVHVGSQEMQEASGHMEADGKASLSESMKVVRVVQQPPLEEETKVDVSGEGSILATPSIHSAPEKLKEAQVDEKVAPGRAPKTRVKLKLLPKKRVRKPLTRETSRELPQIPQMRNECEAVRNMTKKQWKAFSDAFNFFPKDTDGNINLYSLEVTAQQLGISLAGQEAYYKLVCAEADGDKAMNFSDFLTTITDKNCFIQTVFPEKSDSGSFDYVDARGILLCKVLLKLVELAALPRKTLLQIASYYQQKLRDYTGHKAWLDADFLTSYRKNNNKTRKDLVYPMTSFVSAARIPMMKEKEAAAYMERLKGSVPRTSSPYAQVPIFPLILNEDTKTLVKPKKNMQKLLRQRKKEPVASTQTCSIHKRNHVQEAATLKPPARSRKQKRSPTISSAQPNRQHHPKTGNQGKTQAHTSVRSSPTPHLPSRSRPHSTPHSEARVAQQYQHSLALRQRASLLKLWRKIGGAEIGRQTGSKRFHHTFSTYSWSWNACQELVTADELQALDRLNRRHRRATRQATTTKWTSLDPTRTR
ncbi:EF-hand calcium-binding domain-containing protein 3 isoform X2 [Cygnus olor]|uniref:EF-hand calcium-binding domain-containing protein 3 isoform X2 n=1 Tax=Cygnus olor TaxID=8869 RepID=UPI001ADE7790|nr:EF-hand calcium-binding domain-containing protein 3 isoform X2 [Cygnus olor]